MTDGKARAAKLSLFQPGNQESHKTLLQVASTRSRARKSAGLHILTLAACDLTPVVPLNRPRVHYSTEIKLYRIYNSTRGGSR